MWDGVIGQILSAAGFAGALLILLGAAYWRKERSEITALRALTIQAEDHGKQIRLLQADFIVKLEELSNKRTSEAREYAEALRRVTDNLMKVVQEVAVTNTEVKAVLLEIRRDIRHRNRSGSSPGFDPAGGD